MALRKIEYRHPMKDSPVQIGWVHDINFAGFSATIETKDGHLLSIDAEAIRFLSPPFEDMPLPDKAHKAAGYQQS